MFPLKDDIPTRRRPVMTVLLIAANVVVFLFQSAVGLQASVFLLGLTPAELLAGQDVFPHALVPPWETVFTSMFTHGGLMHIGGNMLFLWIFGNNVEDDMGSFRFLLFYLICGVTAAAGQVISAPSSMVPMVGASGAVAGVLGAYLLLYPHARVLTLVPPFFLFWIPAVVFLVLWFLGQLMGIIAPDSGVAFAAHVAGFVMGLLLVKPFAGRIWRTDEEGGWRVQQPRWRRGV